MLVRLSELGQTATRVAHAVAILGQQTTLPTITEMLELTLEDVVRCSPTHSLPSGSSTGWKYHSGSSIR